MDECLKKTGSKSLEALMTKIHSEIRKAPEYKKSDKGKGDVSKRIAPNKRLTKKEKEARVAKKLAKIKKAMAAKK